MHASGLKAMFDGIWHLPCSAAIHIAFMSLWSNLQAGTWVYLGLPFSALSSTCNNGMSTLFAYGQQMHMFLAGVT
jgi:hypothetical protein